MTGGAIGLTVSRLVNRIIVTGAVGMTVYGVTWLLFFLGIWLPLLPMLLSLSASSLLAYNWCRVSRGDVPWNVSTQPTFYH
ncbi:hypothetical protein [Dactylococcopsis salina]|uniref:hypothetical protein n=1 Tax=Dactylococcopsis salina TaxID=292566 RepID=UPI000319B605|nr:hypothetical protein [Dactylococcopsis salina]